MVFDNLFNKKSAQAAAPSKGAAPPQRAPIGSHAPQAGPLELAKESAIGADFQSVVDEAAIIFAGGEERVAAEMLIAFLKQTNGQANRRVWFMLLDLYQALDQQEQYEKLSLMFASRFGTSPPSWEEAVGGGAEKSAGVAKSAVMGGRNVLIVDGPAGEQIGAKSKDFVAASREMRSCKLDVSRMKMEQSTLDGIAALQSIMSQLRRHKVAATLMGENHVASWLDKKMAAVKGDPNPNDTPYWMLSLELLQWRGLMESFEEQSLDYTITYEISGPGWEPSGVMTIAAVGDEAALAPAHGSSMIEPDEVITDVSIQRLQESISAALADKGEARLDFRRVRRMAFSSAGTFLNMLSLLGERGKRVVIVDPSELILALGDVVGFGQCVTLEERRR